MATAHRTRKDRIIHGCARKGQQTNEYQIWAAMIARCVRPDNTAFHEYGAVGVTVCDRWRNSFAMFLADMGPRPSPKHSIDRKDGQRGYCPDNCRWATPKEQARNTKRNRLITFNGETMCVAAWAERIGWKQNILHDRLRLGWTVEEALTTPKKRRTQKSA